MAARSAYRPFVIALAFLLFLFSAAGLLVTARLALSGHVDFRQLYTAGYMLRSGHGGDLYDYDQTARFQNQLVGPADGALPFNHLGYESLVYAPFSFFRYRTAYALFFGANLLLLVGAFGTLEPYLSSLKEIWSWLPIAVFACFLPITMALIEGQDSIILLALMILSTVGLDRGEDLKAGALLGLTLFKFQYALPIALLFMIWKRWRFISGFAFSAVAVTGISIRIAGLSGLETYFQSLLQMSTKFSSSYAVRYGIHPEFMPNLRGLAYVVADHSSVATNIVTLALSALVLAWAAFRRPSLPLALLAALLVSYHQLITDTSMMVLPAGLALSASITEDSRRQGHTALFAGMVLVGPALLLVAGVRFHLLAIPALALFVLCDGRALEPVSGETCEPAAASGLASPNQTKIRRPVSTKGNASSSHLSESYPENPS